MTFLRPARVATQAILAAARPTICSSPRLLSSTPRFESAASTRSASLTASVLIGGARNFGTSASRSHGGKGRPKKGEGITLIFQKANGEHIETVEANEGDDIVDVSWEYDLDIEAACEKSIACSTCHVIMDSDVYDALEEPSDDENDMLDLAFGLTDTSRLGCQVKVTKAMHNSIIKLPSATRNLRVDGSKPTPH